MSSRVCTRCHEDKPLTEYYKQQLAKRAPFCKDCRNAAMAARRARKKAYARAREAEQRARVNELKMTLSCVDCDWSPLEVSECWRLHFDHIDPATKWRTGEPDQPAFRVYWAWERIMAEIALCEPRCDSCHSYRTQRQRHGLDPHPVAWSRAGALPPSPPTHVSA